MIESRTFHIAKCDVCGAEPDSEAPWRDSPDEACEVAGYSDWWATDKAVLCGTVEPGHLGCAAAITADLTQDDPEGQLEDFRDWCGQVGYELEAFDDAA